VLFVSDSTVTFKGFVTNTVSVSTHGGGFGFSSTGSDYRCEYRDSKMNIVSYGFDEMERIASKLWAVYQGEFKVVREL